MTSTGYNATPTGLECDIYRVENNRAFSKNKNEFELKKHVAIIHCSNRLTLLQHKIANAFLFYARNMLLTQDEHTIHIQQLSELIGYDSKDFKGLKTAIKGLLGTVLEWNILDKNQPESSKIWVASSIIADVTIQGPLCTYSYSKRMRELLYRPEMYGSIDMQVQAKFKSTYGIALYENCIRYRNLTQTPWIDLLTFRKIMGIDDSKYQVFRDFKKRILETAINEVNKFSPLIITLNLKKEGRAVTFIQFLIKSKETQKSEVFTGTPEKLPVLDKLISTFGISKSVATSLVNKYPEDYIKDKIELVINSPQLSKGSIKGIAGFLISAIKNDYINQRTGLQLYNDTLDEKAVIRSNEAKKQKLRQEQHEKNLYDYNEYLNNEFNNFIKTLSKSELERLKCEWVGKFSIENPMQFHAIKKNLGDKWLNYKAIKAFFKLFLINNYSHIYNEPLSFDQFINNN